MAWLRLSKSLYKHIKLRQCLLWHTVNDPHALEDVRGLEIEQADGHEVVLAHFIRESGKNIIKRIIEQNIRQLIA